MIIAGLGFSSSATAQDIVAAIDEALKLQGVARDELAGLASIESKRHSPALQNAANSLGVGVQIIAQARLQAVSFLTLTRSQKSLAATGVPSVSEAAALGAANGAGRLLASRTICGPVTCALVQMENEVKLET